MKTSLSIFVPVYNEQFLVKESLERLFILEESSLLKRVQVIVVDDFSSDNTSVILKELETTLPLRSTIIEWKFLSHKKNYGKGRAIQSALKKADCDISIIHDADLEYHPKDILKIIEIFVNEGADAVFGSRFAMHEHRRVLMYRHQLGNKFLTFFSNLLSDLNLSDMEACYKAVKTSLLQSIPLESDDFRIEPEITIKLAKRNAKIYEIPIAYTPRTYQEGKKINWKDGVKAFFAIVKFANSDNIYTDDVYQSQILVRLARAKKFNTWLTDIIRPYVGNNVLEIGSGIGNITKQLVPRDKYHVTDINENFLESLEKIQEGKPYLSIENLDINDVSKLNDKNILFDSIVCLNILEHIDDDEKALKNIVSLLENNGRAIVLVPRKQWAFGSLDAVVGHKRRYSSRSLKELAQKTNIELEKLISFNKISFIPWIINGKIFKRKKFGLLQIVLFDAMIPILRHIDKFLPCPSLSYIAIFKNRDNKS